MRANLASRLYKFVSAVLQKWAVLVTGGVIIGAVGIYQATGHPVKPWLYKAIATIALVVAFFKTWDDQYALAEVEKTKNEKPEITGQVLYALCGISSASTNPDGQGCLLLLRVRITNRRNVDTTIKMAALSLEKDGMKLEGERQPVDSRGHLVRFTDEFGNHQEQVLDLIQKVTYESPVHYRVASEGWLEFFVRGLHQPQGNTVADLTLTIIDEFDQPHVISAKSVRLN
jgi:hypothetical protein